MLANRKPRSARRLSLEGLESRQLMTATTLVLDFSPDGNTSGDFVDTFRNSRFTDRTAPAFLDFNGDRRVTDADAPIAAQMIRNATGTYFNAAATGYNVSLTHGDVLVDSNFGTRYLQFGQQSANEQVLVMMVGGRNGGGVLGRAPIAQPGYNVEGFGRTFTQEIAYSLMKRGGATKEHFVWAVAQTVAHEFGHMLGLQHNRTVYGNDMMNPSQSAQPWKQVFSIYNQGTENGTVQNHFAELQRSFAGQRQYFGNSNYGYALLDGDHDHDDHDHGDHDEDGCDDSLEAMLDALFAANDHGGDEHDHAPDFDTLPEGKSSPTTSIAGLMSGMTAEVADSVFNCDGDSPHNVTLGLANKSNEPTSPIVTVTDDTARKSRSPLRDNTTDKDTLDNLFADADFESELLTLAV